MKKKYSQSKNNPLKAVASLSQYTELDEKIGRMEEKLFGQTSTQSKEWKKDKKALK